MENVVDALYMAFAVLILLIALAVGVSSFTGLKEQVQQLINIDETVDMSKEGTEFINYIKGSGSCRIVKVDTIITTIRKIKNEPYTVYIQFPGSDGNEFNFLEDSKGFRKVALTGATHKYFTKDNMNLLYSHIKDYFFYEYIGIYRRDEGENVSDENNPEHRIIIYKQFDPP